MDAGFFRGTSAEQDNRFANKQKKLLKSMKFAEGLDAKIDMAKVNIETIKPWITKKITGMLGFEDDVVIEYVFNHLDERYPDPKNLQINLTGFLNAKNSRLFLGELWPLLQSAQESATGIPAPFVAMKKEEIKQRQAEAEKLAAVKKSGDEGARPDKDRKRRSKRSRSRSKSRSHSRSRDRYRHHRRSRRSRSKTPQKVSRTKKEELRAPGTSDMEGEQEKTTKNDKAEREGADKTDVYFQVGEKEKVSDVVKGGLPLEDVKKSDGQDIKVGDPENKADEENQNPVCETEPPEETKKLVDVIVEDKSLKKEVGKIDSRSKSKKRSRSRSRRRRSRSRRRKSYSRSRDHRGSRSRRRRSRSYGRRRSRSHSVNRRRSQERSRRCARSPRWHGGHWSQRRQRKKSVSSSSSSSQSSSPDSRKQSEKNKELTQKSEATVQSTPEKVVLTKGSKILASEPAKKYRSPSDMKLDEREMENMEAENKTVELSSKKENSKDDAVSLQKRRQYRARKAQSSASEESSSSSGGDAQKAKGRKRSPSRKSRSRSPWPRRRPRSRGRRPRSPRRSMDWQRRQYSPRRRSLSPKKWSPSRRCESSYRRHERSGSRRRRNSRECKRSPAYSHERRRSKSPRRSSASERRRSYERSQLPSPKPSHRKKSERENVHLKQDKHESSVESVPAISSKPLKEAKDIGETPASESEDDGAKRKKNKVQKKLKRKEKKLRKKKRKVKKSKKDKKMRTKRGKKANDGEEDESTSESEIEAAEHSLSKMMRCTVFTEDEDKSSSEHEKRAEKLESSSSSSSEKIAPPVQRDHSGGPPSASDSEYPIHKKRKIQSKSRKNTSGDLIDGPKGRPRHKIAPRRHEVKRKMKGSESNETSASGPREKLRNVKIKVKPRSISTSTSSDEMIVQKRLQKHRSPEVGQGAEVVAKSRGSENSEHKQAVGQRKLNKNRQTKMPSKEESSTSLSSSSSEDDIPMARQRMKRTKAESTDEEPIRKKATKSGTERSAWPADQISGLACSESSGSDSCPAEEHHELVAKHARVKHIPKPLPAKTKKVAGSDSDTGEEFGSENERKRSAAVGRKRQEQASVDIQKKKKSSSASSSWSDRSPSPPVKESGRRSNRKKVAQRSAQSLPRHGKEKTRSTTEPLLRQKRPQKSTSPPPDDREMSSNRVRHRLPSAELDSSSSSSDETERHGKEKQLRRRALASIRNIH